MQWRGCNLGGARDLLISLRAYVDPGDDCGDGVSRVALANEEDAKGTHASKVKRERLWLARAAWEAINLWQKTTGPLRTTPSTLLDSTCRTGVVVDAVTKGNLGKVHCLLGSMGAFMDPTGQCGDTPSQGALAGDDAAVANSENISGASIVSTLDVDHKTLCLAAYHHSRIKMALLDVSNTVSMSTLSQYFNSLFTETPDIEATTAGQASANSNLGSSPQDMKVEARNDLMDVWIPGESRPVADQSKGRITLSVMVPVRHADVLDVCGMPDVSAFTFMEGKFSAAAYDSPLEILARHVRTRSPLVPEIRLRTLSRNTAKTPRRLRCWAGLIRIAQRPLQRVNEPAVPGLGAHSPLAAVPLPQANEPAVPIIGAYNPPAACLFTETPVIEATTAGQASANSNLGSSSQDTKVEACNDLMDVWVPGESRPVADQSKGRITLSVMVPVRHADVLGVCGMVDVSAFTFTGGKFSAAAYDSPLEILARHVRTRRPLVPEMMLKTLSRNRAKTPRRPRCWTGLIRISQRPLQQVNEPAVPALGGHSPLAAVPLPQANEPAVPIIGACNPLAAPATTADIGHAEVVATMPLLSAWVTKKYSNIQAILGRMFLALAKAWNMYKSAGLPFVPARRQHDVACLALGDGAPLNIANDQMVPSAAAPSAFYSFAGVQLAREGWLPTLERHRRTMRGEALRTGCFGTLRALPDDTALTYVDDESGDNPPQAERYFGCCWKTERCCLDPGVPAHAIYPTTSKLLPLICCDSVFDCPGLLQRGPAVRVPRCDAVSQLRDSVARELAMLARTFVTHLDTARHAKSLVLDELRAVHELVFAVHLDDGAGIRKQFVGGAPIAVARVGCLRLLHKAAEANSRRAIAALLEVGCAANVLDSTGVSPLHVAAEHGFVDIVRILLDANADCQAVDAKGDSALMKAAQAGHDNVVKILLQAGANPNAEGRSGDTALHLAARNGESRTIERLAQFRSADMNAVNDMQESALYMAVKNRDTDSIAVLLDEGASITTGFGSFGSAVYLAANLGLHNCLDVIIDFGGKSVDLEGEGTPSPLLHAVQSQDADAVLVLLQHGAGVLQRYDSDNTILHIASDANSVERLMEFGARGNGRNIWNCTPLHCAVIDGKRDVLDALLKADVRVDIDAKTHEGLTALHYAVQEGDTHAIKTLLRNGADTRARTKRRGTALHMAVELDLLDAVKALLGDGAHATRAIDESDSSPPRKASCGKSNAELLPSPLVRPAGGSRKKKKKKNRTGESKLEDLCSAEREECVGAANTPAPYSNCVNSSNDLGESPLHVAASVGNIKVAKTLLACGARPQAIDKQGATPLHTAVVHARHDIVLALLAGGACVGRANNEGKTALHIACDFGGLLSFATIDALIAHDAPTACGESNGSTPLHVAILSLDHTVASAAADSQGTPFSVSEVGSGKESTPLHASVDKSGEDVVEFLLSHGAPVSAKNQQGKSPLRLACEKGHLGIARILLRHGASPGVGGEEGISHLHIACARGNVEMVKLLLVSGAHAGHCWNSRGVSPLHVAAERGHLGAVKALLPRLKRRQIEKCSKLGTTPLMVAVKRRDKDIVAALLNAGADPTGGKREAHPPLSVIAGLASNSDSAEIVRSLLKAGAQPSCFSVEGFLPLHTACAASGDASVVQALLAGGAEINYPCPGDGFLLPLHLAARTGHAEAARALAVTTGVRLDEKANNGATALTMAVSNGRTETVRTLLESGALLEKNVLDENGVDIGSHVHVAIRNGHVDTCRLLLQAMNIEARARAHKLDTDDIGGDRPTDQS